MSAGNLWNTGERSRSTVVAIEFIPNSEIRTTRFASGATDGDVGLVFNTTEGAKALADSKDIRRTALLHHIPYYTTLAGAVAVTRAIKALKAGTLKVAPLQSYVTHPS